MRYGLSVPFHGDEVSFNRVMNTVLIPDMLKTLDGKKAQAKIVWDKEKHLATWEAEVSDAE